MYIIKLNLNNFKSFSDTSIKFEPDVTVFAGNNGAGKSSILRALALLLSWPSKRFANLKANGLKMNEFDIQFGKSSAEISLTLQKDDGEMVEWALGTTLKGRKDLFKSNWELVNAWAQLVQDRLTRNDGNSNIPLFVFYPIDRAIVDVPLKIRTKHAFQAINALDDNMNSQSRFRVFFEWFRNQEDIENEIRLNQDRYYRDKQLEAVRNAIKVIIPGYDGITVRRNPLRMVVYKHGKEIRVDCLSDGEKCLIALVGDLARRLANANPQLESPLEGNGIVLVDEIDLHLHPSWQRNVVNRMKETFKNCQFIFTTHSPQVLGDLLAKHIRLLNKSKDGNVIVETPSRSYGLTSNEIMDELMLENEGSIKKISSNEYVSSKLHEIYALIDEEKYLEAKLKIEKLESETSEIPATIEAKTFLESVSD